MRKKTHEEYVAELAVKNPTVEVIGEYVNANTKILHHCLTHDVYWDTKPNNALMGKGCEMCHIERQSAAKRKTHEEYVAELAIINKNIVVAGRYIDTHVPILHKCIIHGVEWLAYPSNILRGCGCPKCGNKKISDKNKKTHEIYVEELKTTNPNVVVVGEYVNAKTPIRHVCLIHNVEWEISPDSVLQGCGCPECRSKKISGKLIKSHEQYVSEISAANLNVSVVGVYAGAVVPILHKCLIDGNEWYAAPSNILHGYGCPKCNESKGEKAVGLWLDSYSIAYESQKRFDDCRDDKALPFDFYLPNINTAIEYDGKQHYESVEYFGGQESLEYIQKHDKTKDDYCKANGISLLRIPYFKNVEEELSNFLFI